MDLERIGRLINQVAPDLVALQEIDRLVQRTGFVDQPAEYGALTGMEPLFGDFMEYQGGQLRHGHPEQAPGAGVGKSPPPPGR